MTFSRSRHGLAYGWRRGSAMVFLLLAGAACDPAAKQPASNAADTSLAAFFQPKSLKTEDAFSGLNASGIEKCVPDHPVSYCPREEGIFKRPVAELYYQRQLAFLAGNRAFNANWKTDAGENPNRDGLGPVYDAPSCSRCHVNNGRGRPPLTQDEPMKSMIVRISLPGTSGQGGPRPHPHYGTQLNDQAVPGVKPEGRAYFTYQEITGQFADGEPYSLRQPRLQFADLAYGPLGEDIKVSPRVSPLVIGLGLIESVAEKEILAWSDPEDRDGNGISGRPNRVVDPIDGGRKLGRFGWKAGVASLRQQTADALIGDMGISSALHSRQNCSAVQADCWAAGTGGDPEIPPEHFENLLLYMQLLGVTGRRGRSDPEVQRGEEIFAEIGCADCHRPSLTTENRPGLPELAGHRIHPYSDFLLHDMGPGLADGRPEFEANGREWRTPPLWGIGLTEQVGKHSFFLHDGRARGLMEAVLWHGGEAKASRDAVVALGKSDRTALLRFLKSL